ncbi:hypothetical protein Taro_000776 [Colocasia esculenta]|uniref:Uncharacterized protein n=1 Tax=Colocasia esculenta TaxID=4460 RepID=A0A843TCZ0_COLES|nr:hypothetical protein [Colocasia esculenta]
MVIISPPPIPRIPPLRSTGALYLDYPCVTQFAAPIPIRSDPERHSQPQALTTVTASISRPSPASASGVAAAGAHRRRRLHLPSGSRDCGARRRRSPCPVSPRPASARLHRRPTRQSPPLLGLERFVSSAAGRHLPSHCSSIAGPGFTYLCLKKPDGRTVVLLQIFFGDGSTTIARGDDEADGSAVATNAMALPLLPLSLLYIALASGKILEVPNGKDLLFVRPDAVFDKKKPIRKLLYLYWNMLRIEMWKLFSMDLANFEMVQDFRKPLLYVLEIGLVDLCFANEDKKARSSDSNSV